MAKGYLHREDLTAEKFVQVGDMLVYRTGDLARYNADGELEYGGRIDSMVKLRGFRIELGEIENASSQYAGIQAVAAEVKEIGAMQHLCLYYTATGDIDEEQLRAFLSESLAEYMVPTVYMKMDSMPMTPNGKINRKALPLPELKAVEIVAPENATEQQLLDIITDILGTSAFGVTTNLVSVGMTSMTAMKYCARIHASMGVQVSTAQVIKHPTVREIALLANETIKQADSQAPAVRQEQEFYPLTENQKGIYLEWEMNRETIQYNIPFACRFDQLDAATLVAAVKKAVDAHAYMKARLAKVNGEVMQQRRDHDAATVSLTTLDKDYSAAEMSEKLQGRLRPFDLFNEPLYRIEVYQSPSATWLLMDVHHIVFDGISTAVVLADVLKAYHGLPLTSERYTAFDFALDEQDLLTSERYQEAAKRFGDLVSESGVAVYPSSARADGVTSAVVETTIPMDGIDQWVSDKTRGFIVSKGRHRPVLQPYGCYGRQFPAGRLRRSRPAHFTRGAATDADHQQRKGRQCRTAAECRYVCQDAACCLSRGQVRTCCRLCKSHAPAVAGQLRGRLLSLYQDRGGLQAAC